MARTPRGASPIPTTTAPRHWQSTATMTSSSSAAVTASHLRISTTTIASSSKLHTNHHSTTNQACAACKYQRRKCNPDCPLAPFFPADQQRRFLHAHRLFGVSNILKTLRPLRPGLCAEAMASLIFQAEMRAQDPVGGCYRLILGLERQLEMDRAELAATLHQLALCRHQAASSSGSHQPIVLLNNADQEAIYANHHQELLPQTTSSNNAHQEHGGGHNSPQQHHHGGEEQHQLFDYFYYDSAAAGHEEDASSGKPVALDINVDAMHQFDYADDDCQKVDTVHEEMAAGQEEQLDVKCNIDQKDFEMKASLVVDVFDMRLPVAVNNDRAEGVNANIGIDINAVDVNAEVDLNDELQDKDTIGEPQMAVESTQCRRLGLAFSAL